MNSDILIVGHGIAGCTLAMTCYRRGIPFKMVGCSLPGEASPASSGLIAPITGRRYVKAWMVDELVTKALDFYRWTEGVLDDSFFFPVEIVRYLSHPEAKLAWEKRLKDPEYADYISNKKYAILDELNRPYGILTGGYRLDTPGWIGAVRSFLQTKGMYNLLEKPFNLDGAKEGIKIFATGAVDFTFAFRIVPNKGEALLVYMPDWHISSVIKEEVFIVPLAKDGFYWIGSYYDPLPESPGKTEEGKKRLLEAIRKVYSGRLEVLNHYAGIRPTVNDRRPFIGLLPGESMHYIFNGMGTKGTSLTPYWADQLLSHITSGIPLPDEVSPMRYIPEPVYKSRP
jgi:glycine oxidase